MSRCLYCYQPLSLDRGASCHPACSRKLFGKSVPPAFLFTRFTKVKPTWHEFIDLSYLPEVLKQQFHVLLESRFAQLGLE